MRKKRWASLVNHLCQGSSTDTASYKKDSVLVCYGTPFVGQFSPFSGVGPGGDWPRGGTGVHRERKTIHHHRPRAKSELWVAKSTVDTQILENTGESYLP